MKILTKLLIVLMFFLSTVCVWECIQTVQNKQHHMVKTAVSEEYLVLECGYSDSISGANHKMEYDYWSNEECINATTDKNIDITIGNETISGTYLFSSNQVPDNYSSHYYQGSQGTIFATDSQGIPVFFSWDTDKTDAQTISVRTEQECIAIAREFVSRYTEVDRYETSVVQPNDSDYYEITFTKMLNHIPTTDHAVVRVKNNGALYTYSSFMLGKLPDSSDYVFYPDKAKAAVYEKLDAIYCPVKANYTSVSYETPEFRYTVLNNGELALYCVVDVECESSVDGQNTVVISEKVSLILELYG